MEKQLVEVRRSSRVVNLPAPVYKEVVGPFVFHLNAYVLVSFCISNRKVESFSDFVVCGRLWWNGR